MADVHQLARFEAAIGLRDGVEDSREFPFYVRMATIARLSRNGNARVLKNRFSVRLGRFIESFL